MVILCNRESAVIPVAFVLGFYVTIVVNRWWDQLNHVSISPILRILLHSIVDNRLFLSRSIGRMLYFIQVPKPHLFTAGVSL